MVMVVMLVIMVMVVMMMVIMAKRSKEITLILRCCQRFVSKLSSDLRFGQRWSLVMT